MKHSIFVFVCCAALGLLFQVGACSPNGVTTERSAENASESHTHTDGSLADAPSSDASTEPTPETGTPEPTRSERPNDSHSSDGSPGDGSPGDAGSSEQAPDTTPETPARPDWVKGPTIATEANKWVWVDVPGSKCGYGAETGFAVNASPGATTLYLYLQGGGACWNRNRPVGSCFNAVPTSLYLTGFNKTTFQLDVATQAVIRSLFFRRDTPANPFYKSHFAFFPYCTGDVFSGDNTLTSIIGRKMHFHGHKNLKLFLSRLVATFPNVKKVVIAGSSAGGFGVALNWGLIQQAFGDHIRVDMIDDSGPPMEPAKGRWDEWVKAWNMATPPGCTNCTTIANIMNHYKTTMLDRGRKMAFLSYERDSIIRTFFGLIDAFGTAFKKRLTQLLDEFDTIPNAHYFVLPGSLHTMMILGEESIKHKSQISLAQWLGWMFKDDPAWKSLRP